MFAGKEFDVIVHGYACIDNIVKLSGSAKSGDTPTSNKIHFSVGGVTGNAGTVLANLGKKVFLVGRVGKDAMAASLIKHFELIGAKSTFIEDPVYGTSSSIVLIDPESGERTIYHNTEANKGVLAEDLSDEVLEKARHYHFGYLYLSEGVDIPSLLERAQKKGLTTSFDTHGSPTLEGRAAFEECAKHATIAFPSFKEISQFTSFSDPFEMCDYLKKLGPEIVGVKLGEKGAVAATKHSEPCYIPAFNVNSESTLGAGDSFFAGIIDAFLDKKPLKEILLWANAVGAASVEGIATMHITKERVEEIFNSGKQRPQTSKRKT